MSRAIPAAQKLKYRKRLIVGCDGSWQASDLAAGNVTSNVTNICRAISQEATVEGGHSVQQIVYYQSGVGTHYMTSAPSQLGSVAAAELSQNVVEAYNFICANYEQGDQLYLFGFSRGAFTARALAGLICSVGLIKKTYMARFSELYTCYRNNQSVEACAKAINEEAKQNYQKIYRTTDGFEGIHEAFGNETPELIQQYGGASPFKVEIEVVGVWDTVGSLGWPASWLDMYVGDGLRKRANARYRYLNVALSDRIKHAFHALALDEHRRSFSPTLFHKPKSNINTELIQCWFSGVHINCGGGSTNMEGDLGQLADLTFAWMVDLCRPYLTFDEAFLDRFAAMHRITANRLQKRTYPSISIDQSIPAWANPAVGNIVDSFNAVPFYGSLTRSPGEYDLNSELAEVGTKEWEDKWEAYVTNEYIHPSVRIRLDQTLKNWKPEGSEIPWASPVQQRSLRHFTFGQQSGIDSDAADPGHEERLLTRAGSGYEWTKTATQGAVRLVISEWAVASKEFRSLNGATESFEKRLLTEVEHEDSAVELNQYHKVWAELEKPSTSQEFPVAQDPSVIVGKLTAGGLILWYTASLIGRVLLAVIAAVPKAIFSKTSDPSKKTKTAPAY